MSVSNTASTASFTLNQTTSTFTFTFRALTSSPEDIKCIVTTNSTNQNLAYSTDYTVAVDSDGVGGVVTLVSPATISKGTLTVYRATTNTQESDYDDYNQFPANTLETDLDRRTLVSQEQAEALTRTLLLPITVTGVSAELPNPVANKVLGWNSAGTAIENKAEVDTDSVAAAAASAAAAAASATSAAAVVTYKSFVITNPTATADSPLWRVPLGITITAVHVLCVGGTNIVGNLWEYDANGANGSTVGTDITATAGTSVSSTTFTNALISAANYLGWKTTSVSGVVTSAIVSYEYQVT